MQLATNGGPLWLTSKIWEQPEQQQFACTGILTHKHGEHLTQVIFILIKPKIIQFYKNLFPKIYKKGKFLNFFFQNFLLRQPRPKRLCSRRPHGRLFDPICFIRCKWPLWCGFPRSKTMQEPLRIYYLVNFIRTFFQKILGKF